MRHYLRQLKSRQMTNERLIIREAIVRRYSVKKVFLKILQFHGETPVLESATLLKRDLNTDRFL